MIFDNGNEIKIGDYVIHISDDINTTSIDHVLIIASEELHSSENSNMGKHCIGYSLNNNDVIPFYISDLTNQLFRVLTKEEKDTFIYKNLENLI